MLATLQREGVSLENVDVSNRRRVERLYTNVMAGVFLLRQEMSCCMTQYLSVLRQRGNICTRLSIREFLK